MNFREFVKLYESPSLFGGNMWIQTPGTQRVNPKNWDMMQPGQGGTVAPMGGAPGAPRGATPGMGMSATPLFAGSGPGLGNQVPRRMKKK